MVRTEVGWSSPQIPAEPSIGFPGPSAVLGEPLPPPPKDTEALLVCHLSQTS